MTMIQALRSAMDVMMERDDNVVVYGQDVGYFGGVFRCTDGELMLVVGNDGQFKILKSFDNVYGEPFLKGTFKTSSPAKGEAAKKKKKAA